MGKQVFFIPILLEKISSTIFICIIYSLKNKYTIKLSNYNTVKQVNELTHINKCDYSHV